MKSNIPVLKYYLLGALLIICTGIIVYSLMYTIPQRKCEAAGSWWSFRYRTCSSPIYIPTLTRRKPGDPATIDFHDRSKKASNAEAVPIVTTGGSASASRGPLYDRGMAPSVSPEGLTPPP